MPSFTVTAAGQRVNLGISGAAQASFTVTNTSTQTLKGRMLAKPSDSASPDWFSIVGEPVRDFDPNAAQQVVVQLQVPPTAPAGSYAFRLDAVSAVDPDEDFTEGPSVAFDVEGQPPPKKKFPWVPWWVVAVVAGVILAIIIAVVVFLIVRHETRTLSSGTGGIPLNQRFDVDTGKVPAAGEPGADLLWQIVGPAVVLAPPAQSNATLVNIGVVDFDSINRRKLTRLSYGTAGIPHTQLPNNDVFAVHTSDGNFAKVKVTNLDFTIGLQWVVYKG